MKKTQFKMAILSLLLIFMGGGLINAQNRISGTVVDSNGEPIIAASVFVRGSTTIGAQTDVDGAFVIPSVPANAVLVASCIGYTEQEVALRAGQTTVNFVLSEDSEFLDETVVIGYGTQKKSDVTGSVASVDSDAMLKRVPVSLTQGLQGAAAGVVITQSSGDPTGGYSIRIRGVATMNGDTNPLWVVDGVQYGTHSNLSWLDPQDVERIEILKDASATAIYGARGANGVVLVTTKRAKSGKARVDFRADFGISQYARRLEMASLPEFLSAYRASTENDGMAPFTAFTGPYDSQLNYIDWQDVMTQTSYRQSYNLSVSGGSDAARTSFSVGYLDNKGIIVNSWNKRLTMRLSSDFNITKWLKAGYSVNFNTSKGRGGGNMISYARIVPTMDYIDLETNQLVHVPVQYPDGTYGHFVWGDTSYSDKTGGRYQSNPLFDQYNNSRLGIDWDNYGANVRNAAYVEVTILKGLTFRTNLNYDFNGSNSWSYSNSLVSSQYDYDNYDAKGAPKPDRYSTNGSASIGMGAENYLTYDKLFGKNHVTAMVGQSATLSKGSSNSSSTQDLTFDFLRGFFSKDKNTWNDGGGSPNDQVRFASYFARLFYSFDDRYMLTATVRRDGSSNFGATRRWGTFPSFSFGWNLGNEQFIKDLGVFDMLKFRAGWGKTGNANVDATASIPQLSTSGRTFDFFDANGDMDRANGIVQSREIDKGLHWESSVQTNFGVDMAFFKNSLTFTVDYFVRDTDDLILSKSIRPSAGFSSITTNFGKIRNKGWEFALGFKKQFNRDWFFSASATANTNWNRAIDIGSGTTVSGSDGSGWENRQVCYNGLPLGTYQGYVVDHIIKDQAEIDALNAKAVSIYGEGSYYDKAKTGPGDFLFVDTNGDGHVTSEDKQYIGDGFAKLNFGLNLTANFRNWDASAYMYGALGQKVLSWAKRYLTNVSNENNGYFNLLREAATDFWTPSNTNAAYPRMSRTDDADNYRVSDFYVEKADYLKISNFQIGYTFNNKLFGDAIRNLRLYCSINNLLTLSPYNKFGDPEVSGGVTTQGYDSGRYPFPRTYMFGVQVGF